MGHTMKIFAVNVLLAINGVEVFGQTTPCLSDGDCQENVEYCSEGLCREFGSCGQINDCRNPSNLYPLDACVGVLFCSDNEQCGIECDDGFCPPGEEEFECFENPCDVDTCDEPYVSCVSSNCGGCNSHFFDAAGNEVCTETNDQENRCSSNDDCQDTEYCSEGLCREFGSCGQINDCRNPSNNYATIYCLGALSCSDEGLCGIECGEPVCPPGEEEFECLVDPCEVNTCDEPYESCVSSYCGGCNSHFFDAAGNEVCAEANNQENQCSSNDDCQDNEYCSEGICREFGSCGQINDCRNPSNSYATVFCLGELYCSKEGLCGIECGESACPPGEEEFECLVDPCKANTCDEPYESCVSSNCGGCNSHFFDAAGNEVCADNKNQEATCSSNDDCQDNEYCSEGICREFGSCGQLIDCRNPSNSYALPRCIGALSCSDNGQCGIECGEPVCPPGEEEFECIVDPCEANKCDEPYESCVSSYCGGCNSHFFDATGKEVCTQLAGNVGGEMSQVDIGVISDETSREIPDGNSSPPSIEDFFSSAGKSNYSLGRLNLFAATVAACAVFFII